MLRATVTSRESDAVGDDAEVLARLGLVEDLLDAPDARACAARCLAFLSSWAGLERGLIAAVDAEHGTLRGLAGVGDVGVDSDSVVVSLVERDHPLVRALANDDAAKLSRKRAQGPLPGLHPATFWTVPLRPTPARGASSPSATSSSSPSSATSSSSSSATSSSPALGVLLFGGASAPGGVVGWVAHRLAQRLEQLEHARAHAGQQQLAREAGLLRSIINAVTDPIVLTDAHGRIVIANTTAERLLSAQGEGSEGRRRAIALNNMLFSAALSTRDAREARGQAAGRAELPLVDPVDGEDLLFELLSTNVGDGWVSVLRNVTDLHHATEELEGNYRRLRIAEAEVRAERDRLDLIIDSVADPIVVADPGGDIILMNPPAERLFSVDDDGDSAHDDARVRVNEAVFSSFISNLYAMQAARWSGELGLVDPHSGAAVPVEAFAGNVVNEHGEVTAVVTILHDRSEAIERARLYEQVKRHSEELRQRVQEATGALVTQNETLRRQALALEQASNAKSQFLANISHELRTPLNAIIGYTQLLLAGAAGPVPENINKKLDRVDSNSKHLLAIINDLLDVARIESGKMPINVEPIDLAALAVDVVAELDPLAEKSGLQVNVVVDQTLPEIESDRQKVKQILLNLVSNSLKFTREGSVQVRLGVEADRVTIAVEDTGAGISAEDQERIFEDFRQGQNTYSRQGGTGLGLAICLRLAKLLDGGISLHSTVGTGSTFTLHLPRKGPKR